MIPEKNRKKLEEILLQERTITQTQAAELLDISRGQVSNLIKKGKIAADKNKRPYIKAITEYTPSPNMKRTKKEEKK